VRGNPGGRVRGSVVDGGEAADPCPVTGARVC
jgi:hypothetical protein